MLGGVWWYIKGLTVLKKQRFLEKKRVFVSERANIEVIWSLSLDSVKTLTKYIDVFNKQLIHI